MNENYQNPHSQQNFADEEEPIDWMGYIKTLWLKRKNIILVTAVFAVLSVIIALGQKRQYAISVTLAPEVQGKSGSSSLSGIASMLGVGGMSMGSSTDALNITIFPEIVNSTPFLTGLFDVEVTPFVKKDALEEGVVPQPTTIYNHILGKDKEPGFISSLLKSLFGKEEEEDNTLNISYLTKEQSKVVESLQKMISADVDKKTGITQIAVRMDDPMMVTQLADTVCRRLQEYVFEYRTQKERENLDYYSQLADSALEKLVAAQAAYAQSMDNDHSVILQSVSVKKQRLQSEVNLCEQVYTQMVQQREMARAKVQEMKPVFAVVQPASFPQRPATSRAKTCITITFFGFVLVCAWYLFGEQFYATIKDQLSAIKEDEKEPVK